MLREKYLISSSDNYQKSQLVSFWTQCLLLLFVLFCSFETGSHSVDLAALERPTLTKAETHRDLSASALLYSSEIQVISPYWA